MLTIVQTYGGINKVPMQELYRLTEIRETKPALIPPHQHNHYEIYILLSGEVDYCIDDHCFHLTPYDILLIGPSKSHRPIVTDQKGSYSRIVISVNEKVFQNLFPSQTNLSFCFQPQHSGQSYLLSPNPEVLKEIFRLLKCLEKYKKSSGYENDINTFLTLMEFLLILNKESVSLLSDNTSKKAAKKDTPVSTETTIQKVVQYIDANYSQDISLDTLAELFYINKYHLSREFHRIQGESIYQYLTSHRLMVSKQMLLNGSSPKEVAISCGFNDYSNFYRAFRTKYGIGPREFVKARQIDTPSSEKTN